MTVDDVLVVPGATYDQFHLQAWCRSGTIFVGENREISQIRRELQNPSSGDLHHQVAYRTARNFLRDNVDESLPPQRILVMHRK